MEDLNRLRKLELQKYWKKSPRSFTARTGDFQSGSGAIRLKGDLPDDVAVSSVASAKAKLRKLRDAFWRLAKACTGRRASAFTAVGDVLTFHCWSTHAFTKYPSALAFAPDPMVLHNIDIGRDNFIVYKPHKAMSATGRRVVDPCETDVHDVCHKVK